MSKKLEKIIHDVYYVQYLSGAKEILKNYIVEINAHIEANHFLNRKEYFTAVKNLTEKVDELSILKSSDDRLLQKKIQQEIAALARKIITENKKVFIVHGRNIAMRDKVSSLLGKLRIDCVILESEHNAGSTVIEKFIRNAEECKYAIILFSADDVGKFNSETEKLSNRPRQNVILEMGYFMAQIGRQHLFILHEPQKNIENPSDFSGIVYEAFDEYGAWKTKLIKEMKKSGIFIDQDLADRA